MKALRDRLFIALTVSSVITATFFIVTTVSAAEQNSPSPPAITLNDFGKFEARPTAIEKSKGQAPGIRPPDVAKQIDNIIGAKFKRWNDTQATGGRHTLIVQPVIVELRLGRPKRSRLILRLKLIDARTSDVIAQPVFSHLTDDPSVTFSEKHSKEDILTRVVALGMDYLERSYQVTLDKALLEQREVLAKNIAAAEEGIALAQLQLGTRYADAQGVERDIEKAVLWWKKAAYQGNAEAQSKLGGAYANGQGVTQNLKQALEWYSRAADQGESTAKVYMARHNRGTTRFTSFENAKATLGPDGGYDIALMTNPLSLKGRLIAVRLLVFQVLGKSKMLMTNPYMGVAQLDGKIYFASIPSTYAGSHDFVDGMQVDVVAEVTGTRQYETTAGSAKTVPELKIYGIRASR